MDTCLLSTWSRSTCLHCCSWDDSLIESIQLIPLSLSWDLCFPCKFLLLVSCCVKSSSLQKFSKKIFITGFQPVRTSEHMASLGIFALLNAVAVLRYLQSKLSSTEIKYVFTIGVLIAAAVVFCVVVLLTYAGVIAPWSGRYKCNNITMGYLRLRMNFSNRFYSLWDTGYAKIHIPIIASVSEHQPTTWFSFFFDLHILVVTFPVGLWYTIKNINDERVFSMYILLCFVPYHKIIFHLSF